MSARSRPARPPSTRAQIATAVVAVVIAALLGVAGWTVYRAAVSTSESIAAVSGPSAVKQWMCLPYTEFVLDQHRAGLTPEQISAVLEVPEYQRGGQPGLMESVAEISEPRIDSADVCGLPYEIITAATK